MVSQESIEQASATISELSDEQLEEEFNQFFRKQPAICDFVMELTTGSGQNVQELTLFFAYAVFKAAEINVAGELSFVTPEALEQAYRENEAWIDRMSEVDQIDLEATMAPMLLNEAEPHLMEYVISSLNDPQDAEGQLANEEKGAVFIVLKTVITSLSRST